MIEFYTTGKNRIIYKAEKFATEISVTAYFFDPSLNKSECQEFEEIEMGLYYLDYDFLLEGVYIGLFSENGATKTFSTFRIIKLAKQADLESCTKIDNELSKRHGDGKWDKKG